MTQQTDHNIVIYRKRKLRSVVLSRAETEAVFLFVLTWERSDESEKERMLQVRALDTRINNYADRNSDFEHSSFLKAWMRLTVDEQSTLKENWRDRAYPMPDPENAYDRFDRQMKLITDHAQLPEPKVSLLTYMLDDLQHIESATKHAQQLLIDSDMELFVKLNRPATLSSIPSKLRRQLTRYLDRIRLRREEDPPPSP